MLRPQRSMDADAAQARQDCTPHGETDNSPLNSSSSSGGGGDGGGSRNSRNEYYLGGIIALLLQDHRTMSTKSVYSNQYMITDQH